MQRAKITKAVFPVAGFGTRFLPQTKAMPKEMLPLVDKPLIQYAVEEAIAAGVTELIFITSSHKRAIEDHFDRNFELEALLEKKQNMAVLKSIQEMIPKGVNCIYLRQSEPLGLGHAVLCAKPVVGNAPFAVVLADDLLFCPKPALAQMCQVFEEKQSSVIAIEQVALEAVEQYGIVALQAGLVTQIVEKPRPSEAPSQWGVVGRYLFTPEIFEGLENAPRGIGGEQQLTTGIQALLKTQKVYGLEFEGKRFDCGSKLGYLQAMLTLGLHHPELAAPLRAFLEKQLQTESVC